MAQEKSNRGKQLIFVGGAPRSGTTLLQNILDSHPDILGGPEFLHLPDVVHLRKRLRGSIAKEWISLICSYEDVDAGISDLIERLLLPFLHTRNCKYLSEKTPENVLVFQDLLSLFPGARFIHILRDPRAVVASLKQVKARSKRLGQKPPPLSATLQTALRSTKRCIIAGLEASKADRDRVLTVVYENLVMVPNREIKRICDFVGVEMASEMLEPHLSQHLGERAITTLSGNVWYDKAAFRKGIDKGKIDTWKKILSPAEQLAVNLAYQDSQEELAEFGYDLSVEGLTFPKRFFHIVYQGVTLFVDFVARSATFYQTRLRKMVQTVRIQ